MLDFPLLKERLDIFITHMAGIGELALVHRVKEPALRIEHGKGRDPVLDGDVVPPGDVQVLVIPADVDIDYDKVPLNKRGQLGFSHLRIQRMAVGSPIRAEDDDNIATSARGLRDGGSHLLGGIGLTVVEGLLARQRQPSD